MDPATIGAVAGVASALSGFFRKSGANEALFAANRELLRQAINNQIALVQGIVDLQSAIAELQKHLKDLPIEFVGTLYSSDAHTFSDLARDTLHDIYENKRGLKKKHKKRLIEELGKIREKSQGLENYAARNPKHVANLTAVLSAASIAETAWRFASDNRWSESREIASLAEDIVKWSLVSLKTLSSRGFPVVVAETESELNKVIKEWNDHPLKPGRLQIDYAPSLPDPSNNPDNRPAPPGMSGSDDQHDRAPAVEDPVVDIEQIRKDRKLTIFDTEAKVLETLRQGSREGIPINEYQPPPSWPWSEVRYYREILEVRCVVCHQPLRWPRFLVEIIVLDSTQWRRRRWTFDVMHDIRDSRTTRSDDTTEVATLPTFHVTDASIENHFAELGKLLNKRNSLVALGEFLRNEHERCDRHIPILEEKLQSLEGR